jgi:hypothetical protein
MRGLDLDDPQVMSGGLALIARFLANESALGRFRVPEVSRRLRPLLEEGLNRGDHETQPAP